MVKRNHEELLQEAKKALADMGYEPKDCGKSGVVALAEGSAVYAYTAMRWLEEYNKI